jgi:hypothetical protein
VWDRRAIRAPKGRQSIARDVSPWKPDSREIVVQAPTGRNECVVPLGLYGITQFSRCQGFTPLAIDSSPPWGFLLSLGLVVCHSFNLGCHCWLVQHCLRVTASVIPQSSCDSALEQNRNPWRANASKRARTNASIGAEHASLAWAEHCGCFVAPHIRLGLIHCAIFGTSTRAAGGVPQNASSDGVNRRART